MGSKTKQIARNKARNLLASEKHRGTFKTKDGRHIKKFTGAAVIYPDWLRGTETAKAKRRGRNPRSIKATLQRLIQQQMEADKRQRRNRVAKQTRKANR